MKHFCLIIMFAGISAGNMSWLDNGRIRLGVDLSIGGSVTYLGDVKQNVNLINSHDWGRQVQMSFYSGPNPYIPEGAVVNKGWEQLGWNPIQSGDCFGFKSNILEHTNDGTTLYVKCVPMQWPLKNVPGECTFECWFTLEGRAVIVKSRLNNNRSDKTQYPARDQELPAVYTNGAYHRLMTYTGDAPFTGGQITEIQKRNVKPGEFPWSAWMAAENWAALVDENNFGLGVWNPGVYTFIGGFAGKPGNGGPKDAPTGYIAPLHKDILDWNIQYTYNYVLIVDKLEAIRNYVYEHTEKKDGVSFEFNKDRCHWIYNNGHDSGWPIKDYVQVVIKEDKPFEMFSPPVLLTADPNHLFTVVAAATLQSGGDICQGRLYWKTRQTGDFSSEQSIPVSIPADGKFNTVVCKIGRSQGYENIITGLRFDPFTQCHKGDMVQIRSISIGAVKNTGSKENDQ